MTITNDNTGSAYIDAIDELDKLKLQAYGILIAVSPDSNEGRDKLTDTIVANCLWSVRDILEKMGELHKSLHTIYNEDCKNEH